jgi:hypothetical protein
MEDVYFERIAGVGEAPGQNPRRQQQPEVPKGPLELEGEDAESAPSDEHVALDENGFPMTPLRGQDELWFVQAAQLYKPIASGVSTARASGGMLIASGVLTLFWFGLLMLGGGGITDHAVTGVIGLIMLTLGVFERSAAKDLSLARPGAPGRLAINQLMLFGVIALWCGLQMRGVSEGLEASAMTPEVEQVAADFPEMAGQLEGLESLGESIAYMVFGFILVGSLCFQGVLAAYYLSRRKRVRAFHEELPPWVGDIVRTVANGG